MLGRSIPRLSRSVVLLAAASSLASASCSTPPGPRSGPLAAAADSIVGAVPRLTCNGPRACFGFRADTTLYYGTDERGVVNFVARRWDVSPTVLWVVFDSLTSAASAQHGAAAPCPDVDQSWLIKERSWRTRAEEQIAVTATRVPDGVGASSWVQVVRRREPRACGLTESPPLFM